MKKGIIYIHGKGGSAGEAEHYAPLFPGCDVVGLDYRASAPWEAYDEFRSFYDGFEKGRENVRIIANSIGAYFAMNSLYDKKIEEAFFISPIVDMEGLILNMMAAENVTEKELTEKKIIKTSSGEELSPDYLCYVRFHPVIWRIPTHILYGSADFLQSAETVGSFAKATGADLTVMEGGEHWFRTEEQMRFLDRWIKDRT